MKQPKILAISGVKNSGKTTLLCELIPRLKANGVKVAVICRNQQYTGCRHRPMPMEFTLAAAGKLAAQQFL